MSTDYVLNDQKASARRSRPSVLRDAVFRRESDPRAHPHWRTRTVANRVFEPYFGLLDSGGLLELNERLQAAVGTAYRLDRELGGGGMSRVFVAHEPALGRDVVIKVLPPEMSAGVNVDRFRREIQLAARLQHPHIVPLLTAGSEDDLIWYVMPLIEGESLRARLSREVELPVSVAIKILREVADALQYAHSHQVVHRDIKPDNILISNNHAVVTDFGVAKAVSASAGNASLTSLGVALGTPTYMAPEQAAADPHVDHRADIYALGATAFEMLTGRPPFTGASSQTVLAAHITQTPDLVTAHRPTVPHALAELVMRCLAKKPADRWQRADEIMPSLDALLTPAGGTTPTATQPVSAVDFESLARKAHPVRVASLFGLAAVGVLALVWLLIQLLGLPNWVFVGAVGLLAIGLPIMVVTGHHERRRALAAASSAHQPTPTGIQRHLTFRKALLGGVLAFALLGIATTAYASMRLMGIGRVGTLMAKGTLGQRERMLLANLQSNAADSAIAESVTELLRIDLSQSPVISVIEPQNVGEVLTRMQRDPTSRLTSHLAVEIAEREGIKAYVTGEVRAVGSGFAISARIVEAATGEVLVAARESADDPNGVIAAVDRLSKHLRERVGESLRSIRADPPLDQVTTSSIDALRTYTQANQFFFEGSQARAVQLLEQAVALDSTFAMAWRRLGVFYYNRPGFDNDERGRHAITRAWQLRDRLSERERLHVEAYYERSVLRQRQRSVTTYLTLLAKYPDDYTALNNLGVTYRTLGLYTQADDVMWRSIDLDVAPPLTYANLGRYRLDAGDVQQADSILKLLHSRYPALPGLSGPASDIALARFDLETASVEARTGFSGGPGGQWFANTRLSAIARIQGRYAEADRLLREVLRIDIELFNRDALARNHVHELDSVEREAWWPNPAIDALAERFEQLWTKELEIWTGAPAIERDYERFIEAFARLGRPDRAQALYDEYVAILTPEDLESAGRRYRNVFLTAGIDMARGSYAAAVSRMTAACEARRNGFAICTAHPVIAEAYDRLGQVDSALAIYERFTSLQADRQVEDWIWQPQALRRVGELYDQQGNREKALEFYGRFVDLWANADPMLQPIVRQVRQRMAQLAGEGR